MRVYLLPVLLLISAFGMASQSSKRIPTSIEPWVSRFELGAQQTNDPNLQPEFRVNAYGPHLAYEATIVSAWPVKASFIPRDAIDFDTARKLTSAQVIIRVTFRGSQSLMTSTGSFWKQKTREEWMKLVALDADGKRTNPSEIREETDVSQGGAFYLYFPREIDGKPLLNQSMKRVHLEISDPNAKVRLRFHVRRMIVNGELVY